MSQKILLAIQYWHKEQHLVDRLMRLIADLEPRHSDHADVLFMARFDTKHDDDLVRYVSRKFNVMKVTCKRRATGWPHGCNELWFGVMDWIYTMLVAKKIPQYKAVFTFEPDCSPLAPHWIEHFSREWDVGFGGRTRNHIQGAFLEAPGPHVNGNAMFSCDAKFLHWVARRLVGVAPRSGWDYLLYNQFLKWGVRQLPGLKSYWNTTTFNETWMEHELYQNTMFIHGVKDVSLMNFCRKKFC